ncbi:hypothetical protein [Paenibacillus agricola]|uniref:Uncharacterized protein n=1 Tax=Paenibacillus agricola TaxID=2716264 RepID=A0ABX0JGQ0_9BACL|nr:hypothetical protein [Paenibacillus agricola]NHN34971.1 hypothetical protein [Paenibacillus agricola]
MELIKSIEVTLEKGYKISTLILLYSGLDIVASLNTAIGKDVQKKDFIEWVNKYVIPHMDVKVTGEDLYAARCAVVHTLASESSMSRQGKATQVFYTWGDNKPEQLQEIIKQNGMNHVTVKIENLIMSFRQGVIDFIGDIPNDPKLIYTVLQRSEYMLGYNSIPFLDEAE